MDYGIFFFAADHDSATQGDPYRLFRESALVADRRGFNTVWMPERHFHKFGGLYASPSLLAASLAHVTERIQLWAGSVVAPLRDPLRIAEEWAMVDLLSGGRAGVSFASGWAVNDFVLARAQQHYKGRRQLTLDHVDLVRKLWRGEEVTLPNGKGIDTDVRIFPLPGRELDVALTAQSEGTARNAGKLGAGLLMNMHYQSIDKLKSRIDAYRAELAEHHPGKTGRVTVMVHTLLCDEATLRDVATPAYRRYLATNLDLQVQLFAGSGIDTSNMTDQDRDFLIERAAQRMISTVGLIGQPGDCRGRAAAYADAGVDEIACLIDFGAPIDSVLAGLELVAEHLLP